MNQLEEIRPSVNPLYRRLVLLGITLTILYAVYRIFPMVQDLVVVIIISLVLTYIFRPVVMSLERRGVNRIISILAIFAIFTGIATGALNVLVPTLIDEISSLTANIEQIDITSTQTKVIAWLDEKIPGAVALLGLDSGSAQDIINNIREATTGFLGQSLTFLAGAMNALSLSIVVPFLVFFLLKDGDGFMRTTIGRVPNRFFEMTMSLTHRVDKQLGNYIRSVLLESLIIGLIVWAGLEFMGLRFALVLGVINGLLNMIPFFGPMIAYVPTTLVVLLTYQPVGWGLIWMLIVLVTAQALDNIFLKPLLISKSTSVHPATVLLAVLVGGRVAGAIGMFVAVPAFSIIQVIVVDLYDHLKSYKII